MARGSDHRFSDHGRVRGSSIVCRHGQIPSPWDVGLFTTGGLVRAVATDDCAGRSYFLLRCCERWFARRRRCARGGGGLGRGGCRCAGMALGVWRLGGACRGASEPRPPICVLCARVASRGDECLDGRGKAVVWGSLRARSGGVSEAPRIRGVRRCDERRRGGMVVGVRGALGQQNHHTTASVQHALSFQKRK